MESEYERLRKKVENYPSASAYNRLAELARLNGDDGEAERVCQRCIKEFPRNGQAYVILAEISLGRGRKDEALSQLHNAVERDARSYAGHRMLAEVYTNDQQLGKALHHLRQILVFKPGDPQVTTKIDELSARAGSSGAAPAPARKPSTNTFRGGNDAMANVAITPGGVPILTAKAAAAPNSRTASLHALCAETGVRGAVVADNQGRVVVVHGIDAQADLLAALAADLTTCAAETLTSLGHNQLTSWIIEFDKGQILAFRRDAVLTLAILADPGVRAALLELRARQVLIDLGAA